MQTIAAVLMVAAGLQAGSWTLPRGAAVKDSGPRVYSFVVDYNAASTQGQVVQRERVVGRYTRGLPDGEVRWNDVSYAVASGGGVFGPAEKRDYMEGFHYRLASGQETLQPDFFKGFPPVAMYERNLVWDVQMFEAFGQTQFANLRLNEPYHFQPGRDIDLAGAGKFQNRDVQLTFTGLSKRNGAECAVIDYRAYFNPLELDTGGVKMKARSHYWGQIWVSLKTLQIEYATLYEDVLGELKLPGQDAPRVINVFRSGVFEPVSGK